MAGTPTGNNMISMSFNPKDLKNLKITQKEMNSFFATGFRNMMTSMLVLSRIDHNWKNRTGQTAGGMRKHINRNGTSGKIFNPSDVSKFLYYGTTKHWVEPTRKSALSWVDESSGDRRFSKGHWVSGIKAEPWVENNYFKREAKFLAMIEKSAIDGMTKKWS